MKKSLIGALIIIFVLAFTNCASLKKGSVFGGGAVKGENIKVYVYGANNEMILGAKVEVETSIPPIFIGSTDQYGFVLVKFKKLKYELPILRVSILGYKSHIAKLEKTLDNSIKVILFRR